MEKYKHINYLTIERLGEIIDKVNEDLISASTDDKLVLFDNFIEQIEDLHSYMTHHLTKGGTINQEVDNE